MATDRDRPYGQCNFLVDLGDGVGDTGPDAGFAEVEGLDVTIEVVEYREGNARRNSPIKLNGLTKYGDVSLRRGLIGSRRLWEWLVASMEGDPEARRTVRIRLLDERHRDVLVWTLREARPIRHVSGPLRAGGSDIAVEELVLAHEGLDIE